MKVLIAEQSRNVSTALKTVFEEYGIETDIANDGVQALGRLVTGEYDFLITESLLPRIDGETLVKLAREREIKVKTIGILPKSEINEKDLINGYGMDALLPKPFSVFDLIGLITVLEKESNTEYPKLLHHQRALIECLRKEKSVSTDKIREVFPETFGTIYALIHSTNKKLAKIGEKLRIVSDENGYKVVNV